MMVGHVEKEMYALKWVPEENSRGRFLDCLPLVKGIKLMKEGSRVKMHYCNTCENFIINKHEIV